MVALSVAVVISIFCAVRSKLILQVYPGGWTAVLVSLNNVGVWNLRVENLDRWYLGQEEYMRIVNPEENGETEMGPPNKCSLLRCLKNLQKEQNQSSAISILSGNLKLFFSMLMALSASIFIFY